MKIDVVVLDKRLLNSMPKKATEGSAAFDLRAAIINAVVLEPGQQTKIPSGIKIHIKDPGYAGIILPRSGLGGEHGVVLGNLVGLIDSDYVGEIQIMVWNRSSEKRIIRPLEKIAQFLVIPIMQFDWNIVDRIDSTDRGAGGFGSSGRF